MLVKLRYSEGVSIARGIGALSVILVWTGSAAVRQNVEYGEAHGVTLLMDASLPESGARTPAVILVHGGAWVAGDKRASFRPIQKLLVDSGFATFAINYRLAPKFLFPSAVHDVETAVRFIADNAAEYNVDPERIVLIGESAGAQLVEMAALDQQTHVAALVSFYAPSDLSGLAKSGAVPDSIRQIIGDSPITDMVLQGLHQMSPVQMVRKNMPPILFIHGTGDSVVPFDSSKSMCDRMKEAGASCEVISVPGGDHGMSTWEGHAEMQVYKQPMLEWLKRTLSR